MREALQATHRGVRILELARELLAIGEEGLRRQAATNDAGDDERIHLEGLRGQLATGRSPARVIAEKWAGEWGRRVEPLIEYVRLRPL
jgi:glutamate--cysteine ligase